MKALRYIERNPERPWEQVEREVVSREVVDTYEPSGINSLLIRLEDGREVKIMEPYLNDMQSKGFTLTGVKRLEAVKGGGQ